MTNIKKIVLTGGPCAGKTTGINKVINEFSQIGYTVLVIPETATELINGGIKPFDSYLFQKLLLETQLNKEKIYEKSVKMLGTNKILIICDRGALDGKAYINEDNYNSILKEENLTEVELRDNYDAVYHLVTAAKGAESYYTLSNNNARIETLEEAKSIDNKIMNAWSGHPHFRIIDNSTNFESKINKLIEEIYCLLGEPVPLEIERKYLIKKPNVEELLQKYCCTKVDIVQTYLKSENNDIEKRIRQRGSNGNYIYTITTKETITGLERIEKEKSISVKEYVSLLPEANTLLHQIRKQRYCFVYESQYFELDVYPFSEDKAILEIELTNKNKEVNIPKFINVIKEVTEDKMYKNKSLAETLTL